MLPDTSTKPNFEQLFQHFFDFSDIISQEEAVVHTPDNSQLLSSSSVPQNSSSTTDKSSSVGPNVNLKTRRHKLDWKDQMMNKLSKCCGGGLYCTPLVPIEVSYLRDYSIAPGQYNLIIPVEITFFKEHDHLLFVKHLQHVLRAVQRKHPFLQASVVSENNTTDINDKWYFSWEHKNPIPFHSIETNDYEKIMRQELHTAFPLTGPMIRVTLCQGEKLILLVTAFHLIVDGATLLQVVKEMIQLLGQMDHMDAYAQRNQDQIAYMETMTTRPIPKSLVEQLDSKNQFNLVEHWLFFFKFLYLQWKQIGFNAITFPLTPHLNRELQSDFVTFELDTVTTNRILTKVKQNNVSMNSFLSAVSAKLASKFVSLKDSNPIIPIAVPFDLRRNIPSVKNTVEDIRALSTGIFLFLKVKQNVWDMAQSAQQQIRKLVHSDFAIHFFQLYQILIKISKSGDDNKCLVCSSFPPIENMDTGNQFESTIRGIVMSTYHSTNMVSVYLLTVKNRFIFNIWFNTSVQKEPVLQFAKNLEQYMHEVGSE